MATTFVFALTIAGAGLDVATINTITEETSKRLTDAGARVDRAFAEGSTQTDTAGDARAADIARAVDAASRRLVAENVSDREVYASELATREERIDRQAASIAQDAIALIDRDAQIAALAARVEALSASPAITVTPEAPPLTGTVEPAGLAS